MYEAKRAPLGGQGPGSVLAVILRNGGATRAQLEAETGLSRPTITERLRALTAAGLVKTTSKRQASGGRPAQLIEFNERAYISLCIDIGEGVARVAVADLGAHILDDTIVPIHVADGPEPVIATISAAAHQLLASEKFANDRLGGVAIGMPAPVDFGTGKTIGWSVMSGWEGYDIKARFQQEFSVPVLVDNDVNLLLLAEHRLHWPDVTHLFFVKVGTGIGSGLVVDSQVNRGYLGAAGDIGHAHVPGHGDPLCRCGNRGCLESLAGGWALARDLRAQGEKYADVHSARDVSATIQRGDSEAMALIRESGRVVGQAVAFATSLLNPAVIVVGGELARAGDHLVAGIRELVYQRSLPLATKDLVIALSSLDGSAGVVGAAILAADAIVDPERIDAIVR